MDLSINQRLKEFLTYKKISYETFRKMINCTHIQQISNWMAIREKIPDKYLIAIIVKLTDLDARWLITGEGNMKYIIDGIKRETENSELEQAKAENAMKGFYLEATGLTEVMEELKKTMSTMNSTINDIQKNMTYFNILKPEVPEAKVLESGKDLERDNERDFENKI